MMATDHHTLAHLAGLLVREHAEADEITEALEMVRDATRREALADARKRRCGSCATQVGVSPDGEVHDNGHFCPVAWIHLLEADNAR